MKTPDKFFHFFFTTIHPGFNRPLFASQKDLVGYGKRLPTLDIKNKKEQTLRSAISQFFSGERNISKKWASNFAIILDSLLSTNKIPKKNRKAILNNYNLAIEDVKTNFVKKKAKDKSLLRLYPALHGFSEINQNDIDFLGNLIKESGGAVSFDSFLDILIRRKRPS